MNGVEVESMPPHIDMAEIDAAAREELGETVPVNDITSSAGLTYRAESIAGDGNHCFTVWRDGEKVLDWGLGIASEDDCSRFTKKLTELFPVESETSIELVLSKFREAFESGKNKPEPEGYFTLVDAEQLANGDFKLEYLIPGIMARTQPMILAGQFKTLKTSIGLDAALSLASGTKFLDRFEIPERRKVLVLTAESGLATIQETCKRICDSRWISLADQKDYFAVTDRVPRLQNTHHVDELTKIVEDGKFDVIFADPAYLMIDGENAANVFAMGDQLRIFADVAKGTGATPILIHHAKKNTNNIAEYQPLELADIAWAGFAEFARQWLLLSRRERYVEGSGEHLLWMTAGGSAGHNGCWGVNVEEGHPSDTTGRVWRLAVDGAQAAKDSADERREQAREAAKAKQVARDAEKLRSAFIGVGTNGITKTDANARAGLSAGKGQKALGLLLTDGIVEPCQVRKANGQTYDGYRLANPGTESDASEAGEELFP